ncbi:MAG: transposase [Spirochaetales bacterium]|nr:transposase [Spirochaetales bacterium]
MKKGQYTEEKIVSILREAQQTENSGRPIQNGMVESLNENWFLNLDDARKQTEQFKKDYNTDREPSSLGRLTPAEFKAKIKQTLSRQVG